MSILTRDRNETSNDKPGYPVRTVAPLVDVFENAEEVLVVADVPGVGVDGVDVRVENGTLTLQAKHPSRQEQSGPALAREYDEVDRARSFRIPDGIDTGRISAEARNGTVLVRLPKVAAVKPRKIDVRAS